MGALAPVSPWIPEDDLLLKSAVEAGASLESLAKGAVHFSRRFTVRELQDRWFTLLYDPIVSADASARMIEFERSGSMLSSKFNRFGNSKENKCATGKRKVDSVRSYYYALRKRICNEPFNSMDLSFLVGPTNNTYVGNGDEPLTGNCMLGDPVSNPFGLEVSEMDTMTSAFPNDLMDAGDATINTFHTGLQNPAEENFPVEQNINEEIPHVLGENMPSTIYVSGGEGMGEPSDLPDHSLFDAVELEVKPSPAFDQVNGDQSNMCPEFEGNKGFSSPVSGCVAPFNNMEYSSPLPGMPIWKTVSTPALPVDINTGDRDICSGDAFHLPDDCDAGNTRTSGYDVHSEVKVKMEMPYDDFRAHNSPDNYLAELSNCLLNFTNEEELLFMNPDGKDMIDKSYYDGLSSLLLSSPNDVGQDQMTSITELETSVAPEVCARNSSGLCHGGLHDEKDKESQKGDEQMSCNSHTQLQPSISASNIQFPELKDGVICCVLNTEDPEIPCNDDVFLSNQPAVMSSTAEVNRRISSSVMDFSSNQRNSDRGPNLIHKERKTPGGSHVSSQMMGSHVSQEMSLNPSVGTFGVKFAVSKSNLANMASTVLDKINAGNSSSKTLIPETLKEDTREMLMAKHLNSTDISIEKPALGSASFRSYPHTSAIGVKEEHDGSRDQESVHAELTPMDTAVSEPLLDNPTADQDGVLYESDDEIPCYSDIEAMILDMDLDPGDRDLPSSEEVSRYQQEDTKRAIIRLEQSAHSYMQRAIASHGALAILYGRHSKHYIKKPEVLLGRATFEIPVDIDLGREGRSNKISRRQAIIKMDKGGTFHLKNLSSRFSISVNSKEVGPKQSLTLDSSCLIEIRGIPLIFESNLTCVKMYLDSIAKG
ncbi:Serine/threonine protein kinase [Trema orientale]|uniref:Serine/threonine protein kinase n=1 Tax=Trema orientale TaxID=63057 RepID=A0A2P5EZN4_TREOI|nr:Serine/threonine protein kinase [Trema orientale]